MNLNHCSQQVSTDDPLNPIWSTFLTNFMIARRAVPQRQLNNGSKNDLPMVVLELELSPLPSTNLARRSLVAAVLLRLPPPSSCVLSVSNVVTV